jgi:hypothetical protein
MEALRRAAEQLLLELGEDADAAANDAQIERVSCDVLSARGDELVSIRLSEGRLLRSCSCGERSCAHLKQSLRMIAGQRSAVGATDATRRSTSRLERVVPEARADVPKLTPNLAQALALCEPLLDAVTAVVRAGVSSDRVASVLETLARVERAAGSPLPLGVRRWLGLMREALDAHDPALAAQALGSAAAFAADLRTDTPNAGAQQRIVSWLGASGDALERISDRVLLEVAREWVTGTERVQIERRYLIDLHSGEVFREECVRRERAGSLGSCPRLIGVGLAEAELGAAPRRMRLLQYTTTPDVDRASWDLLAAWGQRDSEALVAAYRSAQSQTGALAEPFALVSPRSIAQGAPSVLMLDRGAPLPLAADDEPGVLRRFESMSVKETPLWVAGRLFDRAGQLMLKPLAAGILSADRIRHERL